MANKRKSKGYGTLWMIAIALIGVFVLATVIAPQLTGHGQTNSSDGWNTDMPSGQAIFLAPTTTLSGSGLQVNQVSDFSVSASPVEDTTGSGGIFGWVFQLEGANGQSNIVNLKYDGGDSSVVWSNASNGAIVGVGPRFVQGPGAQSMDVSSSLSLAFTAKGSYTLKIWIAKSSTNATDVNPSNYTSVSPMAKITITTDQATNSSVSVEQTMSVPSSTITKGTWTSFTATTTATGTGRWTGPITINIAIDKSAIKVSDLSLRVSSGSGYSFPKLTDQGDRLVAQLATQTPLTGKSDPETATVTTTFQISFASVGTYSLSTWAENGNTKEQLGEVTSDTIQVQSTVVTPIPTPTPVDPNSTNTTNSTVLNQSQTPVETPLANSSSVESVAAANGSSRSSG